MSFEVVHSAGRLPPPSSCRPQLPFAPFLQQLFLPSCYVLLSFQRQQPPLPLPIRRVEPDLTESCHPRRAEPRHRRLQRVSSSAQLLPCQGWLFLSLSSAEKVQHGLLPPHSCRSMPFPSSQIAFKSRLSCLKCRASHQFCSLMAGRRWVLSGTGAEEQQPVGQQKLPGACKVKATAGSFT